MADFTFNIAKGLEAYYASLPAANDALIMVPLEATGLEADAVLKDYDNLQVLLAGPTNEQTTMGRKALATVTSTVDDTNDWRDIDFADPVWVAATGNGVGAVLVCYDPDTTGGTDADIVPITKHDFVVTPNGGDITAQVPTGGFLRVQ
jgi:hypothetical protein